LISVTLNTGPNGEHVILCGFDLFLYSYYRHYEHQFVAIKCDGPFRIKAHPPIKLVTATFERCRDIFQKTTVEKCLNDIVRPQYITIKGHVLMDREDVVSDNRDMSQIFLHQCPDIESPRIAIYIPSRRSTEVRFKRCNVFSRVLFDPSYGRNSRLLDSGLISIADEDSETTAGPSGGCKRKRVNHLYDDDFDTDDESASVSIIPHGMGDTTGMTQTLDGGNSPHYSPASPLRRRRSPPNTQEFEIFRSPPRKVTKKSSFY
jgi:hypothetical protein